MDDLEKFSVKKLLILTVSLDKCNIYTYICVIII